jgi:hypothetical protein
MSSPGQFLVAIGLLSLIFFLLLHAQSWWSSHHSLHAPSVGPERLRFGSRKEVLDLIQLIKLQNHTIHVLEDRLRAELSRSVGSGQVVDEAKAVLAKIQAEQDEFQRLQVQQSLAVAEAKTQATIVTSLQPVTLFESECDARYGLHLIDDWRKQRELWCAADGTTDTAAAAPGVGPSELECFPYHQQHKKLDGRGPDVFCVATNFVIDFSKLDSSFDNSHKPALGSQYINFQAGSLLANCRKTRSFKHNLFMPHQQQQVTTVPTMRRYPLSILIYSMLTVSKVCGWSDGVIR